MLSVKKRKIGGKIKGRGKQVKKLNKNLKSESKTFFKEKGFTKGPLYEFRVKHRF